MKILHILSDSNVGGAGILLENLLTCSALPHSCYTIVLPRGAAMAPRLSARGFRVLDCLHGHDRSLSFSDFWPLFALLRRERPDILHTHASLTGRAAGWLAGVPIRLATRHCAWGEVHHPAMRLLHRLGDAQLSTCTVATAHAAAEDLLAQGIEREKILLIPNGARALLRLPHGARLSIRASLGIPAEAFVVGICARLTPEKDHATLLRAAARLLSVHTGYHFLLVGGGPEETKLQQLIRSLQIEAYVTMTGYKEDIAPYVNLFDVAVNCSCGTETACLALSEAMSLSIPCVASRYGGNSELVQDEENGLLFAVGDDAALAKCLFRLSHDRALYHRLSLGAGERYLKKGQAEQMARRYDSLYLMLYDAPRKRGELRRPPAAAWERLSPFCPAKNGQG